MSKALSFVALFVVAVAVSVASAQLVTTYGYPNTWSGYRVHYETAPSYYRSYYNYNYPYYSNYGYTPYYANGAYLNAASYVVPYYKK